MKPSITLHPEDVEHVLALARYYLEFAFTWADDIAEDDEALEIAGHREFCRGLLAEEAEGMFIDEDDENAMRALLLRHPEKSL